MMRKGILVVVHNQAAGGAATNEGKTIILLRCRIPVGQDILQHIRHGMCPAESANDASFFSRILLLTGRVLDPFLHRLCSRPERGIPPISIGFQDFIGIEERLIGVMEKELAVFGRTGPVHQAGRLEGGRVKTREVQVIRNAPGYSRILIGGDRARQRNNQTQAHFLRGMAMGTVQRIRIDEGRVQIIHEARIRIVSIQAQHAAVDHAGIIALAILQIAADETTDVLHHITIRLRHRGVIGNGLPGTSSRSHLIQELTPHHFFVLPLRSFPAPANGKQEFAVMIHMHSIFSFQLTSMGNCRILSMCHLMAKRFPLECRGNLNCVLGIKSGLRPNCGHRPQSVYVVWSVLKCRADHFSVGAEQQLPSQDPQSLR